jgi:hypothetical protein
MPRRRSARIGRLWLTKSNAAGVAILTSAALLLAGCTGSSLKTYPVHGKVELKDGDVTILTGSHIELRHETDEMLRPSGKIESGGSFAVQTLHKGEILPGAPEGKYKARLILGDESDEGVPKRKGNPVHQRYLNFETSGLLFTVPSNGYSVSLSRK